MDQVWNELRLVRREEVGPATQRIDETSGLGQSYLPQQHAIAHGAPDPGDEHGTVVHEDPVRPNAGSPRKQQLLCCQHQHRAWRLRMVRCAKRVLGRVAAALQEEQRRLFARILVGQHERVGRSRNPYLSVHAATWRSGLGQRGLRPLGPSFRSVQQHRLEHWPSDAPPIRPRHRTLRVEQDSAVPVDRGHGPPVMESRAQHSDRRWQAVQRHQKHVGRKHQADGPDAQLRALNGRRRQVPWKVKELRVWQIYYFNFY